MQEKLDNEKPAISETLGGELKAGWDSTDRLPSRLDNYRTLKLRTMEFLTWGIQSNVFIKPRKSVLSHHRLLEEKLRDCGQYLIFRNYLESKKTRLLGACTCKVHLLCAFCAARRGVRNSVAYKEKVEHLVKENPDLDLVFLTFTVKNGVDLIERFNHLRQAMKKLLARRVQNTHGRGQSQTEMHKLTGGVFAYEFKRGSGSDLWHPHIHMLALIPKGLRVNIELLKIEWHGLTQDSSVINIEYCKNDNAYLEVFAYALKFSEMSHPDRWFAYNALIGERLISSFGSLRGVDVPESLTDDMLESDEPFVDVLYRWHFGRLNYQKHEDLRNSAIEKLDRLAV